MKVTVILPAAGLGTRMGRAVPEKAGKQRAVLGRGDQHDVSQPREHERRKRVVHEGLVVQRQQLLGNRARHRVQARTGTPGENDAFGNQSTCSQGGICSTKPNVYNSLHHRRR